MKRVLLLFWVLLSFISVKTEAQNIYLVSVGVSDYPGTVRDLKLPANDARTIHRLFKQNAKAVSVLITNANATRERVVRYASILFSQAGSDDIVLFFFSGHGYRGGFSLYDGYLSYQKLRSIFSACRAKNKMIFADACYSGDIRENRVARFKDPNNRVMLFLSSRSDECSKELSNMRNGLFTASLCRALKGGADTNYDRIITARELYAAVSNMVVELSNDTQHPVMWGNFPDSMPIMVW